MTDLHTFSLPTLLQMVEMERRSCTLKVTSNGKKGSLFFREGRLIDAEAGEALGEPAVREMLGWKRTQTEINRGCEREAEPMESSLAALLLSYTSQLDEETHAAQADSSQSGKESFVSSILEVIERFKAEVPEFVATDVVHIESGLSIGGGSIDPAFDASVASAAYAEVVKSNSRALDLLGFGDEATEDILITATEIYVLLRRLGGNYYHAVAISRRGNLGLARALMKKFEPLLLKAIGELD